jgi:hypothetical protein
LGLKLPGAPPFELFYTSQAQEDIEYWRRTNQQISHRIDRLLADVVQHPFTGIGKPNRFAINWLDIGHAELRLSIALCTKWMATRPLSPSVDFIINSELTARGRAV